LTFVLTKPGTSIGSARANFLVKAYCKSTHQHCNKPYTTKLGRIEPPIAAGALGELQGQQQQRPAAAAASSSSGHNSCT
jgi:hypothetical protein